MLSVACLGACPKQSAYPFQVFGRVHTGTRSLFTHMHGNALAMPEHSQLLQRFDLLQRTQGQLRKTTQKLRPVAVEAYMAQG